MGRRGGEGGERRERGRRRKEKEEDVAAAAKAAAPQKGRKKREARFSSGLLVAKRWRLGKALGQGSFGEIFEATDETRRPGGTAHSYAIKLEPDAASRKRSVLKLEAVIMQKVFGNPLFCRFRAYGRDRDADTSFLVMERQGANLLSLLRGSPAGHFSAATVLRVGLHAVRALEALHEAGYLHRDVKPSNFVVARAPAAGAGVVDAGPGWSTPARRAPRAGVRLAVHMIDFGLARAYMSSKGSTVGSVLPARTNVSGFRGTARYASLEAHHHRDLGRRDDLWSVLYMLVELRTGALPWTRLREHDDIRDCKEAHHTPAKLLGGGCPPSFRRIMRHIRSLGFADRPDYDMLVRELAADLAREAVPGDAPYDWEAPAPAASTECTTAPSCGGTAGEPLPDMTGSAARPQPARLSARSVVAEAGEPERHPQQPQPQIKRRALPALVAIKASSTPSLACSSGGLPSTSQVPREGSLGGGAAGSVASPTPPVAPAPSVKRRGLSFRRFRAFPSAAAGPSARAGAHGGGT